MAQAQDKIGIIYQNLVDAGCDKQTTDRCMSLVRSGSASELLPILTQYKTALLCSVRAGQKQIDCLDFLIYKVKKELV